ncbi:sialin-like isoform X2 [Paramacrobiotus metropolitanus]|uniref:sialin-like isoform X2 n=1 Tax=Paramacrobiotus metropolitanus TaxID=2943436 RepID=UPI002445A74A|nr:sialin-like isoform X2 [Paramacrobiotus metropolitanus]
MGNEKEYHSGRIGHRHGLLLLSFLGTLFMYSTRANLSMSMVAMVSPPVDSNNKTPSEANSTFPVACPHLVMQQSSQHYLPSSNVSDKAKVKRKYNWDSSKQGLLHSAFYYGYLLPQVFGGWISHRIGAKLPIAVSVGSIGILTIISPFAADLGSWCFFSVRLLIGLGQGVVFPSLTVLWTTWAPPLERGRLLATTYTGAQLGVVFGISLSGVLAEALGWESIYYFYGSICCVWTIFWLLFAYDSPDRHPKISHAEKTYIRHSLIRPNSDSKLSDDSNSDIDKGNVPWSGILRTVPFWALLAVEFGHNWAFYTLLTNLPTYLSNILHYSLKSNGVLSALPYTLRFVLTMISLFASDWIQSRQHWSTTFLRKFFSLGAFLGCGAALVGVAFSGCNSTLTLVLFTFGVGISGHHYRHGKYGGNNDRHNCAALGWCADQWSRRSFGGELANCFPNFRCNVLCYIGHIQCFWLC